MQPRPVWPALLSLAGAIVPFVIVATVNATTITGGEDFRGVVNFVFTPLGLVLLVFSILQFGDVDHRRVWGSMVALFCALEGALVLAFFGSSLYSVSSVIQFLLFFGGPVLGFAGGLWGVFWKRSWIQGAAVPGLAGASRRVVVGGSMALVLTLPFLLINGDYEWIFAIPALLVVVSGFSLYKGKRNPRVLGGMIIASSVIAGYPFYGIASQLVIDASFDTYILWSLLALTGAILAATGGLQIILWKKETEPRGVR